MTMLFGLSPVYCAASVKVTLSPTSGLPAGLRDFAIDRSEPGVVVKLTVLVLLSATGSRGLVP